MPQTTRRPPAANEWRDAANNAGPTWSKTTSTPLPPVAARASAATSSVDELMTTSAPIAAARRSVSSEREVAITVAPRWRATWIAVVLTPLPAPWISTVSPRCRSAVPTRPRHAVDSDVGKAAA